MQEINIKDLPDFPGRKLNETKFQNPSESEVTEFQKACDAAKCPDKLEPREIISNEEAASLFRPAIRLPDSKFKCGKDVPTPADLEAIYDSFEPEVRG